MEKEKILTLKTGKKYVVIGETGRYWLCRGGTQFRKSNPEIESVKMSEAKQPAKAKIKKNKKETERHD